MSPVLKQPAPQAIVFDLDGTLVDSARDIHAAASAFLIERGHEPLDLATVTSFIGNGVPVLLERIMEAVGEASDPVSVEGALRRFNRIYNAAPSALSRLYPGVVEALTELQAAGCVLGICTNKPVAPARRMLADLGIADFFTALTGGDSLPQRKPDPAPLRRTAVALKTETAGLIYVGDSEVDAATAQAAGVTFVLFTEGYRKSPVEALVHQARFSDFGELPGLIAALARSPAA
jgi:phosphoglycolate phosphatase